MPDAPEAEIGSRREARERILALLYEAESKGLTPEETVAALPVPLEGYAAEIMGGIGPRVGELDALIVKYARNWDLDRMPSLDRAILRMAAYELVDRPDVPPKVIINEAVDLAKRYSTEDSGRFVNGLLAKLAEELRPISQ